MKTTKRSKMNNKIRFFIKDYYFKLNINDKRWLFENINFIIDDEEEIIIDNIDNLSELSKEY